MKSLEKWSGWAKNKPQRLQQENAVKFLKDVETCVSGEVRFLLEVSGKLVEALFSLFHDAYIAPLREYWAGTSYSEGLKEAFALFKAGKLRDASHEPLGGAPAAPGILPNFPLTLRAQHDGRFNALDTNYNNMNMQHNSYTCGPSQSFHQDSKMSPSDTISCSYMTNGKNGLPSFLDNPYWKSKLPETFGKIVWLHEMDEETLELWDNSPPTIVPSTFNRNLPEIATQVLQFIATATMDELMVYHNGERASGKTRDEMRGIAFNCYNQALVPTDCSNQTPQQSFTMLDVDIPSTPTPPDSLSSRWNICKTVSSSLVTPTGAYTDLHYDTLYRGYAEPVGGCDKLWLIFPPNPNWESTDWGCLRTPLVE
ncbi:hypothetical protein V492_00371 [Pseudogymnoascus sp. VKM F-4246]|nr:hypothetical protein V492_00371 [Pseudogymnoascus sp. VKM F-4246]